MGIYNKRISTDPSGRARARVCVCVSVLYAHINTLGRVCNLCYCLALILMAHVRCSDARVDGSKYTLNN